MWSNRHLIWIFYKPIAIVNILFSCGAIRLVQLAGWNFLIMAIILKLSGYGLVAGYQYLMSQNNFYYYRNAGLSMRIMYVYTYTLDFILFMLMLTALFLIS